MGIPTHKSSLLLRACYQPLRDEPICGAGIGMEETGNERKKEKKRGRLCPDPSPLPHTATLQSSQALLSL